MLSRFKHLEFKRAVSARLGEQLLASEPLPPGGATQRAFIRALFACMGKLAKLDGRVTEAEIACATSVMQQLGLTGQDRQEAIDYFYAGKLDQTDIEQVLAELLPSIGRGSALARQFLAVQCRLTYSKGFIRLKEKLLLRDIAEELGFDKAQLLTVCTEVQVGHAGQAGQVRHEGMQSEYRATGTEHFSASREADLLVPRRSGKLGQAYGLLELRPDANDLEIRQAYRRMLNRYHPDKLTARSASAEALRHAQEQFHAVTQAYETICGFRKMVNP